MTQYEKLTEAAAPISVEKFLASLEEYIRQWTPGSALEEQAYWARVNFARVAHLAPPPTMTRAAETPEDFVRGLINLQNWARSIARVTGAPSDVKRLLANLRILREAFAQPEQEKL